MTIETAIYKGAEVLLTAAGSAGTKLIVDEAVKKLTPENLNKIQSYCVEVAKWGGATAASAAVAAGIHVNVEKAKKLADKINSIFDKVDKKAEAEPVIDMDEDNSPVEIVETEEIPIVDLQ